MTRFMMTLDNAIELYFMHLKMENKEIFVQKAPAVKVSILAQALWSYDSKSPIQEIGIRHGEKKHETLVTLEK